MQRQSRWGGRLGGSHGVVFGSKCGPVEHWWLGRESWREATLGSGPLYMADWLGPEAVKYKLIEGYYGDPAVSAQRTEVVIEEGVPFSLFPFPARELHRLQQY